MKNLVFLFLAIVAILLTSCAKEEDFQSIQWTECSLVGGDSWFAGAYTCSVQIRYRDSLELVADTFYKKVCRIYSIEENGKQIFTLIPQKEVGGNIFYAGPELNEFKVSTSKYCTVFTVWFFRMEYYVVSNGVVVKIPYYAHTRVNPEANSVEFVDKGEVVYTLNL